MLPWFWAKIVAIADAIEGVGFGHGQGTQHDRMDQREDGRRAANAKRQRQDSRGGEHGGESKLPQRVTDCIEDVPHKPSLVEQFINKVMYFFTGIQHRIRVLADATDRHGSFDP